MEARGGNQDSQLWVEFGPLGRIANAFPSFVSVKSAKIRAVLSPYTSLSDFQRWVHEGKIEEANKLRDLTFTYDRCSIYMDTLHSDFNAYSRFCADFDDIINNHSGYIARTTKEGSGKGNRKGKDDGGDVTNGGGDKGDENKSGGDSSMDNTMTKKDENTEQSSKRMNIMNIIIKKLGEVRNIKLENEDLSNAKYLCRAAMLFIQQEAMDIVDSPRRVDKQEYFGEMPRDYICPANMAQLLPEVCPNPPHCTGCIY
jgi:hypothetical protein